MRSLSQNCPLVSGMPRWFTGGLRWLLGQSPQGRSVVRSDRQWHQSHKIEPLIISVGKVSSSWVHHFRKENVMKSMNWKPDEHDKEANQYLDKINHAPYFTLGLVAICVFCVFTFMVLMGAFWCNFLSPLSWNRKKSNFDFLHQRLWLISWLLGEFSWVDFMLW